MNVSRDLLIGDCCGVVCVFLVVGGERHVFKVHVNGVKKGVLQAVKLL